MIFKNYFNREWKSPNEVVRRKFVESLDSSKNLVKLIVKVLDNEKSLEIRKLALKKITSEEQVVEIIEKLSNNRAKLDAKQYLMDLVAKHYADGSLKNEAHLDFIDSKDRLIELFFLVKDFNKKKKLMSRIADKNDLLTVMEKLDLKDKDIIKLVIHRLAGSEVLVLFLEDSQWEQMREKYFVEILSALRENEVLFQSYKARILERMEKEIISSLEAKILDLSKHDITTDLPDSTETIEKLKEKYVFDGKLEPLSEKILAKVVEYQKLYLEIKTRRQDRLKLETSLNDLKSKKLKIDNLIEKRDDLTANQLEQEILSLEEFYQGFSSKIKSDLEIKTIFSSLKKDMGDLLLEKRAEEQKKIIELEARKKQENSLRVLNQAINDLKEKMNKTNFVDLEGEVNAIQERITSLEGSEEYLKPLLVEAEKSYQELTSNFNLLRREKKEQQILAELMDLERYFSELNFGEKNLDHLALHKKIVHWEKLLNLEFLDQENFKEMFQKHKKLLLEIKKELEEEKFRSIQSYLDRKESLCKALQEALLLKDKKAILEVFFQINRKWNSLAAFSNFYFKEVNDRYSALRKECQKITQDYQEDFKKQQEDKINRKKALIKALEEIIQAKGVDKKAVSLVDKILHEWKEIYVYMPFNEKEMNLEFKQKLNFFFKQKKSEKAHFIAEKKSNLTKKNEWFDAFKKQVSEMSSWQAKLTFMKENRRDWLKLSSGFPIEKNLEVDRKYFSLIEEQFRQQNNPLEERVRTLEEQQEEISLLVKKDYASLLEFKKDWDLFAIAKRSLIDSLLPKKNFFPLKKVLVGNENKFRDKNAKWFEELRRELESNLEAKENWLKKIIQYNQEKNFTKERNEEVKSIVKQWNELGRIPKKISINLERDFKKNVNVFYKGLKENIKDRMKSSEENYLAKKKILHSLEHLANWGSKTEVKVDETFNPEELKDIWEYNRQFKGSGSKQKKSDRKKEVFFLLNKWNERTDLTFQQRKELNEHFNQIKAKLKREGLLY